MFKKLKKKARFRRSVEVTCIKGGLTASYSSCQLACAETQAGLRVTNPEEVTYSHWKVSDRYFFLQNEETIFERIYMFRTNHGWYLCDFFLGGYMVHPSIPLPGTNHEPMT